MTTSYPNDASAAHDAFLLPSWQTSFAHARSLLESKRTSRGAAHASAQASLTSDAARFYLRWLRSRGVREAADVAPHRDADLLFRRTMKLAGSVRVRAQAPYSGFAVGAALLCADGAIVEGINVESSSYGCTICAERTALVSALTAGKRRFVMLAVRANTATPITPCGACRQLLCDYAPELLVVMMSGTDSRSMAYMKELLPGAFNGDALKGSAGSR